MVTPFAAHGGLVEFSTDDITYTTCAGVSDVKTNVARKLLETTNFDDGAYKIRIAGLRSATFDISGDYDASDATQQLINDAAGDGSTIYVQYRWDEGASDGVKCACKVSKLSVSAAVDGIVSFSASFVSDGAPTIF